MRSTITIMWIIFISINSIRWSIRILRVRLMLGILRIRWCCWIRNNRWIRTTIWISRRITLLIVWITTPSCITKNKYIYILNFLINYSLRISSWICIYTIGWNCSSIISINTLLSIWIINLLLLLLLLII